MGETPNTFEHHVSAEFAKGIQRQVDEGKTFYEVWGYENGDFLEFTSDDPVKIVHWLRKHPLDKRLFNVHPRGPGYHRDKLGSYDFIQKHREIAAEDILKRAFEKGSFEGVAEDIINMAFGK